MDLKRGMQNEDDELAFCFGLYLRFGRVSAWAARMVPLDVGECGSRERSFLSEKRLLGR